MRSPIALAAALLLTLPGAARAQHDHAANAAGAAPAAAGQDAFAAIAEVVRALEADPATDWSRVSIDALRRHLVDMHEVTLRSAAAQRAVPGGIVVDVTGVGRTIDAVRRMTRAHVAQLDADARYVASADEIPGGARVTVRAEDPRDVALVARLRALGFYGLLVQGEHHGPHHLMIARGAHH
jgi:hypothetical protein